MNEDPMKRILSMSERIKEALAKLPEMAYAKNTLHCSGPRGEPPVICVKRGESAYYAIYTTRTAEELNGELGVTPEQAAAMVHGSLFGWDTPGADPDHELHKKTAAVEAVEIEYDSDLLTIGKVKARLAYLRERHKYGQPEEDVSEKAWAEWHELGELESVEHDCNWCWDQDNATLIHVSHFDTYAREQAYDIGQVEKDSLVDSHVNWAAYARDVMQDYKPVWLPDDNYFYIRA